MTLAHHAHLARELRAVEARLRHLDQPAPDTHGDDADQVAVNQAHEEVVAERGRLEEVRGLILIALDKVKAGTYGLCEGCCQPIPGKRLAAMPYAPNCIECQGQMEDAAARQRAPQPVDMMPGDEDYLL